LVCAVGSNWLNKAEIDAETIRRAAHVVCDDVAACRHEAGDLHAAAEAGAFDWSKAVGLADVVAGRTAAKPNQSEIAVFKSVGLAAEDVALGGWIGAPKGSVDRGRYPGMRIRVRLRVANGSERPIGEISLDPLHVPADRELREIELRWDPGVSGSVLVAFEAVDRSPDGLARSWIKLRGLYVR
jgi:hypothetical protein